MLHVPVALVEEATDKYRTPTAYAWLVAAAACESSSRNPSVIKTRRDPPLAPETVVLPTRIPDILVTFHDNLFS